MSASKQVMLVIYESPNGRDGWRMLKPEEVPGWVREPDNMERLVRGDMCMDCVAESAWYRADVIRHDDAETKRIAAARAKRIRRSERRVLEAHRQAQRDKNRVLH